MYDEEEDAVKRDVKPPAPAYEGLPLDERPALDPPVFCSIGEDAAVIMKVQGLGYIIFRTHKGTDGVNDMCLASATQIQVENA